mmetsp:Transcript_7295/g.6464  ORF Transcript_7295/g.6464 Transcript_7295/m.6464 type:complete len:113 (+) Transcript_7295:1456-1794(+)
MKKPPKVIKLILKCVCLLLEVKPARKKLADGFTFKDSYWKAAQSIEVLGNSKLPELLLEFDKNSVTPETMILIEDVIRDEEEYNFENVYRASKAATGMFQWVRAIREYYYIY